MNNKAKLTLRSRCGMLTIIAAGLLFSGCGEEVAFEAAQTDSLSHLQAAIQRLGSDELLVSRIRSDVVIDGFSADIPQPVGAWECIGGGAAFVGCTKKIVDNNGCAIVVPHGDHYCSKPC